MSEQVRLYQPTAGIVPVGKSAHWDGLLQQRAELGGATASPLFLAYRLQAPIHGRQADLQRQAFCFHGQRQFLLALQHGSHLR